MKQHKNPFKLHFNPTSWGRRFQVSCKLKLLLEARNKTRKRWYHQRWQERGERRRCRSRFIVLTWNSTRYRTGNFRRNSQSLGNCESSVGADGRVVLILLPSSSVAVNKKRRGINVVDIRGLSSISTVSTWKIASLREKKRKRDEWIY